MPARLLDGESLAARIRERLSAEVAELRRAGVTPGLGTILVGDDTASARYVAMKHSDSGTVGILSVHEQLSADASQEELERVIAGFNTDPAIDAYLVQLPLPGHLDADRALL